jgi:hypothetical protein
MGRVTARIGQVTANESTPCWATSKGAGGELEPASVAASDTTVETDHRSRHELRLCGVGDGFGNLGGSA